MEFLKEIDFRFFHLINSTLSLPPLDRFFPLITDLHKTLTFEIMIPLLVILLLLKKYGWQGWIVFVGCIVCLGFSDGFITHAIKHQVQRERPFNTSGVVAIQRSPAHGYSFPSNHATNSFAFANYLSIFIPEMTPIFFLLLALLTAYSRIYNGVHFPSDVVGGALLGLLISWIFARLILWILSKTEAPRPIPRSQSFRPPRRKK